MTNVPPDLWVGPTLGGAFDYREPTQIGRIKKLGIQEAVGPPRSYGLVARLDAEGRQSKAFTAASTAEFMALPRSRIGAPVS